MQYFYYDFCGIIFDKSQPFLTINKYIKLKVYILLSITRHVSPDFCLFHNFWK